MCGKRVIDDREDEYAFQLSEQSGIEGFLPQTIKRRRGHGVYSLADVLNGERYDSDYSSSGAGSCSEDQADEGPTQDLTRPQLSRAGLAHQVPAKGGIRNGVPEADGVRYSLRPRDSIMPSNRTITNGAVARVRGKARRRGSSRTLRPSREPTVHRGQSRYARRRSSSDSSSSSSSTSSSSSDDGIRPVPLTMAGPPLDWGSIAGYSTQLALLQETVLLPLLFPSFFSTHGIDPPKGILFYGPPGTGKTLAARVLAHVMASIAVPGEGVSSAQGTHSNEVVRPSFYMRKGADVLSKYVGESERALRLLFAEAERNSPSIIFFDEIDGLAPARSSRNDHVHASVVSTLLALMDGLESRGRVVVIGATNRVDALDPALRRPGRFDREVLFGLPDSSSRRSILDMYGKRMTHDVRGWLTQETGGFAGADLRALCAEASLSALRRIGLLDAIAGRSSSADTSSMVSRLRTSVGKLSSMDFTVEREDAAHALKRVVPASRRSQISLAQTLPPHLEQILAKPLQETIDTVSSVFLPPSLALSSLSASTNLMLAAHYRPWVLITSPGEYRGQHEILGAICHMYDSFSQVSLDLATLAADPNSRSLEEALVRAVSMARRSLPCLLIIPMLDLWYASASEQLRSLLVATLKQIPRTSPILVLATTDGPLGSLATEFSSVFADQVIQLKPFSSADKLQVFQHLAEQLGLSATEKSCLIEAVAKHVHNWSFDHVLKMFARMMRASLTAVGKITSHLLSEVLPQV